MFKAPLGECGGVKCVAKAENYIVENLTPMVRIQIYKNLLHTYYALGPGPGARWGLVRIRSHSHLRTTTEGFTHSEQMRPGAQIELKSALVENCLARGAGAGGGSG